MPPDPLEPSGSPQPPGALPHGPGAAAGTLHLAMHAMACDFGAVVRAGAAELLLQCGTALEVVPEIESWLSPWREDSELSRLNALPAEEPFEPSAALLDLLCLAKDLHEQTDGAFDLATGAQIVLWKRCREEKRLPTEEEIRAALAASGMARLSVHREPPEVRKKTDGLLLDPGAIGKGWALDEAARNLLDAEPKADFLLHGGRSSVTARGTHGQSDGWPVGIGNPLLTRRRLGTVILRNQALSTSGSNIQFFRVGDRRFGHILDPRTGWPTDGMLSVSVVADSAAVADALSTAFFVLGVEKAAACCDTMKGIGAILIPFPERGSRVQPTIVGIPDDQILWDETPVTLR